MAYSAPMFCVRINLLQDLKRINLDQRNNLNQRINLDQKINLLPTLTKRIHTSITLIPKVNWTAKVSQK